MPLAIEALPRAVDLELEAVAPLPIAVLFPSLATAARPIAVLSRPPAIEPWPTAVALPAIAEALSPTAVESTPVAALLAPHSVVPATSNPPVMR
jgi:hypothetical protein